MRIPKRILELDTSGELKKLWESVYIERYEITKSSNKAKISANARVYAECLKQYRNGELNG